MLQAPLQLMQALQARCVLLYLQLRCKTSVCCAHVRFVAAGPFPVLDSDEDMPRQAGS